MPLVDEYLAETSKPKKDWKQTPHSWCKYCSYCSTCKAYNQQLAEVPQKSQFEIETKLENLPKIMELFNKVKAISEAADSVMSSLKYKYEQLLTENGRVNIGGRTYEIREKVSRYQYDLPKIFVETQKLTGILPVQLCEYSGSGAKEFEKSLTKEDKKTFKTIVENSRTVKSKSKTLSVTISKEPVEEAGEADALMIENCEAPF